MSFCISRPIRAQEHPVEVSGCGLARNPKAFDHKLVRVRGRLNVEFEDFVLGLGKCNTPQEIWLAFGGDVPGIVASTANDTVRKPNADIRVDGISLAIKKDDSFRRLYALIASRPGNKPAYRVTATLTGMFFAGHETKYGGGPLRYAGYGHLDCCSLLVITTVSDVESVPPAKLDLRGVVVGPDKKPLAGITVIDDIAGGSPPLRQTAVTNAQGRFAFSNSGRQLRIENPDYRPVALTASPGRAPVRVKLQDAKKSDWVIQRCGITTSRNKRTGFSVLFALPSSVESKKFDNDGEETLFVYRRGSDELHANLFISHEPYLAIDYADSLGSRSVSERWIRDAGGRIVGIDARGRNTYHGEYWRSLSFLSGDYVFYSASPSWNDLRLANRIIDSACFARADSKVLGDSPK